MQPVLATFVRVLTLRFRASDLEGLGRPHLVAGLVCTWLAGIGRFWDNPRASLLQTLGLGSVVYVFVLSAFLWLLIKPLRPERWSYVHLLTFVTLTAPPAFLYAVPVERWVSLSTARSVNVWFLAIVALWRVVIYGLYLRRWAGLRVLGLIPALLLPLCLVVTALSVLNLDHAVFDIMAGLRGPGTPDDDAYAVLILITLLSFYLVPVLLILYFVEIVRARRRAAGNPSFA